MNSPINRVNNSIKESESSPIRPTRLLNWKKNVGISLRELCNSTRELSDSILPVRAPGHLQLDLLAVFDVTFEGLIDQQSVTEDSTRPSFFEHAS